MTTFAAPPTRPRRGTAAADAVIAAAIDVARAAAVDVAGQHHVGEHQGVRSDGQRLATHYFASTAPGYRGWRWAVTMARAPRAKNATVCEVALLAGEEAITAPEWLPWSERLQPGDVGREDVLPYSPDDPRLMPGYAATGDADADRLALYELGLGRPRVLSPEGRAQAATRWITGEHGPVELSGPGARAGRRGGRVRAQCSTCGFLLLMAGSMRTVFGVCSNEWSPDDGQVVSMDHGCGAHSETDVLDTGRDWPENAPVVDDLALELVDHGVRRDAPQAEHHGGRAELVAPPAQEESPVQDTALPDAASQEAAAVQEEPSTHEVPLVLSGSPVPEVLPDAGEAAHEEPLVTSGSPVQEVSPNADDPAPDVPAAQGPAPGEQGAQDPPPEP